MATTSFAEKIARIYTLSDPHTREVRYCGKTTTSIQTRWACHRCSVYDWPDRPLSKWLMSIIRDKEEPIIRCVEKIQIGGMKRSEADALVNSSERQWISHFREMGCDLVNVSNGGTGPGLRTRANMSLAQQARDPSTRRNRSGVFNESDDGSARRRDRLRSILNSRLQERVASMKPQITGEQAVEIFQSRLAVKNLARNYGVNINTIYDIQASNTFSEWTKGLKRFRVNKTFKLSDAQIVDIFMSLKLTRHLAKIHGVGVSTINRIRSGRYGARVTNNLQQYNYRRGEMQC